jgi:hypothetical protein
MRCSRYRPISEGATGQAAYLSRGFSNPRGSFSVTCPTSIIQGDTLRDSDPPPLAAGDRKMYNKCHGTAASWERSQGLKIVHP